MKRVQRARERKERKKAEKLWLKIEQKFVSCIVGRIEGDAQETFVEIDEKHDGLIDEEELKTA
eukprot:CAMPEP_0197067190 /NCGR_PEP_ID=MMETSP1384-20130603/178607_1 /TAXON_ID=29189 /ORGANISM="Ammonia sp." /LENGTH=62 /DNA_ID=CAMNT_0042504565 /DNA_START=87 /DNA_END=272 /DNA_ORIENTATION=-